MISSFHPHSMCKKVERVTAKTGCTSCTKRTISFEVQGFHTETRLLKRDFIFLNLFELLVFLFSKCTIQSHIIDFQPFLASLVFFMHLLIFLCYKTLKLKKALQMNSKMVESWHGVIISPTQHVQESREAYGKNWTHFVYKTDNLIRSIRVSHGNSSVTKGFHFIELIRTPQFFCVQNAPFKATSSIFNPF